MPQGFLLVGDSCMQQAAGLLHERIDVLG